MIIAVSGDIIDPSKADMFDKVMQKPLFAPELRLLLTDI